MEGGLWVPSEISACPFFQLLKRCSNGCIRGDRGIKIPISGALQGRNSWSSGKTIGYRGPAPPPGHGVHHYHFKLYALDTSPQTVTS